MKILRIRELLEHARAENEKLRAELRIAQAQLDYTTMMTDTAIEPDEEEVENDE